jgi:choline dehydrogenase-like flavoprotein
MDMYDVIVIGTGAGGGMTIKTLCEAGLKVCALNAGRQLDPAKDFRMHKQPYDLKFRSFDSPARRKISIGYMDSEYVSPDVWEHDIAYSTAPGTSWTWPRCNGVGAHG